MLPGLREEHTGMAGMGAREQPPWVRAGIRSGSRWTGYPMQEGQGGRGGI